MENPVKQERDRAGRITALLHRYVALCERRAGLLCVVFALLCAATLPPIARLGLRTDMAALLPDAHPAVQALKRIDGQLRSMLYMFVALRSGDATQNRRCLAALIPKLQGLVPAHFSEIQLGPRRDIPEFIQKNKLLYTPLADLQRIEMLTERAIARRAHPLLVDLEDEDPEAALRNMHAELSRRLPAASPLPAYYEATAGGEHYMAVLLWRPLAGVGSSSDQKAVQSVAELVAAASGTVCAPAVRMQLGGLLVVALEEQAAIREDMTLASAFCILLVLLAIYLHFRRVLLVVMLGIPAVSAVLLALALASLTAGELNMNSAFLMSIILGNGINPGIIVLSRYSEERLHGRRVSEALAQALLPTLRGTGTAMAAASIAYGCLALTSFRGFSQFGLLGGAGMFLSWFCTLLMVPPLLILGERFAPAHMQPRPSFYRRPFFRFGQTTTRFPRLVLLFCAASAVASAVALWHYAADPLEWDFTKLRAQATPGQQIADRLAQAGIGDLGMGYVGDYGVLRVDREEEAEPVAEALRQRAKTPARQGLVTTVRTLKSLLPEQQPEKLEVLKRLRAQLMRHRDQLEAADKRELDALVGAELRVLTVEDLPESARLAFTEIRGTRGRLIGVDHDRRYDDWNGHMMLRMAELLNFEVDGKRWVAACAATLFGGMLEAILHDGPRVSLIALSGVVVMVFLVIGLPGALLVLTALMLGILWLGGVVAALGLKINYINFVTLPVAIGMGTDYAANIWSAWRGDGNSTAGPFPQSGAARLAAVLAETGAAVTLCSLTTIIGYCSLLLAGNRALRSFGLMAAVGECSCLLAALLLLPALIARGGGPDRG